MTRKAKPRKTPEQIIARVLDKRSRDMEAANLPPELSNLLQQDAVEVTRAGERRAGKTVENDSARRLDAFEALRPSMKGAEFAGCYDAARRLERDYMIRYGQHDHGRPVDRVDCEQAAFNRNDLMLMAGERVDAVMERLSERDGALMRELIVPTREWANWRKAVQHVTSEANWNAQGAAVRSACVNLRYAYERIDVASRKAA